MYRPVKAGEVFTTFIFDGKDCADMGVYSTTTSGTYTMYIEPTFKDEMVEVPGYDGRYYYGTQYSTQQFNSLCETKHSEDFYEQLQSFKNEYKKSCPTNYFLWIKWNEYYLYEMYQRKIYSK